MTRPSTRGSVDNPNATYDEVIYSERWKQARSPEYHAYRRGWEEVPRNRIDLPFPLHLDIETTNICNLKCPMCPRTLMVAEGTFGEVGMISREDYVSIIDQGVDEGVKSVKLNYLGEPLAHKDVVWQVEYAKAKGIVDVMFNTNGALLKPQMSQALLKAGLDNLFVSFDAVNPRDFNAKRAGTTIGKVTDNVYEFIRLRDEMRPSCQVRLSMVMYDEPKWWEQFEGLQSMWRDVADAVGYGFYVERQPELKPDYDEVPGFVCAQPFQRMFLKYNGNITVCCVDDRDEVVMGDWRKTPLKEIWQSPAYRDFRRAQAENRYHSIDMCRRCYVPVSA